MELILFIILGGFLLIVGGSDRAAHKAATLSSNRRIEWHTKRAMEWKELVSDRALEEDLSYFIADPQNYDAVWDEVHDAYLHMPSCKSFTIILLYQHMVEKFYGKGKYTKKERENIAASHRKDALDIMMAHRGKVPYGYTYEGMGVVSVAPGEGQHSRQVWDETFDKWAYIMGELKGRGVQARLIFKTGGHSEYEQTAYDIEDVEKFRYKAGTFAWLPQTYFDDNLN